VDAGPRARFRIPGCFPRSCIALFRARTQKSRACLNFESPGVAVTYDPARPEHIYAATEKGVFRSRDGGENWVEATSPGPKLAALVFARTGILYAAGEDGTLFRSTDQGNTWNPVNA